MEKALIDAENISTAGYNFSGTDDMSLQMNTGAETSQAVPRVLCT